MAHPVIRPTMPRTVFLAGLAGSLLLAASPAGAGVMTGTLSATCDAVALLDPACEVVGGVVGPVEDAVAPVTGPVTAPVTDAIAPIVEPVIEQVEEAVAPIADALPQEGDPPPIGGDGSPVGGDGSPVGGGDPDDGRPAPAPAGRPTGEASAGAGGDGKIEAAGKEPSEVAEPQSPSAADGRVVSGPTLQPTDLGALGSNIAGVGSQTGLSLQPYDPAPMVSVPTTTDVPQVAGAPVITSSPIAAFAADAFTLAGDVVLPQTASQAALVTVAGLGMLAASGVVLRRRFGGPGLATLDHEIF